MRRLQPDPLSFAIDPLQRGLVPVLEMDNGSLPTRGFRPPLDNEKIAVSHQVIHHGFALHLERIQVLTGIGNVRREFQA